jgi:hypothetical protein
METCFHCGDHFLKNKRHFNRVSLLRKCDATTYKEVFEGAYGKGYCTDATFACNTCASEAHYFAKGTTGLLRLNARKSRYKYEINQLQKLVMSCN